MASLYYTLAAVIGPEPAYWTLVVAILWIGIAPVVWATYAGYQIGWRDARPLPAIARGFVHGAAWPLYAVTLCIVGMAG